VPATYSKFPPGRVQTAASGKQGQLAVSFAGTAEALAVASDTRRSFSLQETISGVTHI
jgi:hypothetical protein